MKVEAVIFDLDGTLLNTLEDLADSVNAILSKHGYPIRDYEEIRRFVGNGVALLIKRALPSEVTEEERKICLEEFRQYYNQNMNHKTRPYDGILFLLQELRKNGIKMAVVSNKYDLAVKELISEKFGEIIPKALAIGEREGIRKKPAPDSTLEALCAMETNPENTLYVGDSDVDMETADNAGLYSIGVTWGFRDREVLEKAGAKEIINQPEELLYIIQKSSK